jgi:hypothetical protein
MTPAPTVRGSARAKRFQGGSLRSLLTQVQAALESRTPQLESGPDVVAARLDVLRGRLWAHFDEEDRTGFFEEIEEKAPETAAACARLRGEHEKLLSRLDSLREASALARRGPDWSRSVRAFLHEFDAHEARETELLSTVLEGPGIAPD